MLWTQLPVAVAPASASSFGLLPWLATRFSRALDRFLQDGQALMLVREFRGSRVWIRQHPQL